MDSETWKKLEKKYHINLNTWNNLNGLRKVNLLKSIGFLSKDIPFGFHEVQYPEDIYLFENTEKCILNSQIVKRLKEFVMNEEREIGGTLSKEGLDISFLGNSKNIYLDYERDSSTLFHTHPAEDREVDPPSVLDIISYLALIVKYVSSLVIDLGKGIEHPADDPLVIQNSMVFAKEGVYIYYISHPLLIEITKKLIEKYLLKTDFIFEVEKLLEEMEISYSYFLSKFNYDMNAENLEEYLKTLKSLGILIQKRDYDEEIESYVIE